MKKPGKVAEGKVGPGSAAAASSLDHKGQTELFARAMQSFTAGDFRGAREIFEEAAAGPALDVVESARMYIRMCEQRISREKLEPRTPEEHYDLGVRLINERKLQMAQQHLATALEAQPDAAHVHYAMALARGLAGDLHGALESLRRAFTLDPQQRGLARGDSDFQELMYHPEIRALLYPERTSGS
jgi:tetratricopeptide (TPR) repeat protein